MQEPGMKKLTMEDVARELGVSKTTVSRSVSGKGRIGKKTRERVLNYIEEHTQKAQPEEKALKKAAEQKQEPQDAAGENASEHVTAAPKPAVLKRKRSKSGTCNIGVVLPADLFASDRPYFPKALKGISEIADSEDYDVIMILVDRNDLSRLSRVIEQRKADGLILIRTLQDEKLMEMLKRSGIPFVAAGVSDDPEIYQADNDYEEACFELTNILLMKGVKKIAAVAGNMSYVMNQKRMDGFYKAHRVRGISPDKSLIFTDVLSPLSAARAADTILMRGAQCIIGADDVLTSHVLRELEEKHVQIPGEIKLASFHDSQLLAAAKTGITAIQFHTEELGRETCRMLLHQIRGEEVPRLTKLSYEVTLRESTK